MQVQRVYEMPRHARALVVIVLLSKIYNLDFGFGLFVLEAAITCAAFNRNHPPLLLLLLQDSLPAPPLILPAPPPRASSRRRNLDYDRNAY